MLRPFGLLRNTRMAHRSKHETIVEKLSEFLQMASTTPAAPLKGIGVVHPSTPYPKARPKNA